MQRFAATYLVMMLMVVAAPASAQDWAVDAVWYQVFPERFHNGDPTNDPTSASLAGTWPYRQPPGWQVSPWTSDWYQLQPWENDGRGFYHHAQLRRYGGDLQGVLDRLDYLQELGVSAIYLNPVFESPSLHKYGAALYHHIDKHFGPDPAGDLELFASEDPADPATWQWSAADRLFLTLLQEAHARDMKVVIDGVFNHVGIPFWAFQRARREGPQSPYAKWFVIKSFDDPTTPRDEFDWEGWAGVRDLPEFRKGPDGPVQEVKAHFWAVARRWMDPNGDGDPSDGIDGWRLDVAKEVPLPFWREFRQVVKSINPDAYLTGEIWWENYRAFELANASPWLEGDAFDAVMNYRFGDAALQFFNERESPIAASQLASMLDQIQSDYGYQRWLFLQNVIGSHDTSRLASCVANPDQRLDHGANLASNRRYNIRRPTADQREKQRQIVAFQFLAPGAPYIYYGDEAGMWGADDPDCRKPMVWADMDYDDERAHPFGQQRASDQVEFDGELFEFYRTLAHLRRGSAVLCRGDFTVLLVDDENRIFAFRRSLGDGRIVAAFNAGEQDVALDASALRIEGGLSQWDVLLGQVDSEQLLVPSKGFTVLQKRVE